MSDTYTTPFETPLEKLKTFLKHVPQGSLLEFKEFLFPFDYSQDIYQGILSNLTLRLESQTAKGIPNSEIAADILSKSSECGPELHKSLANLFETGFLDQLKIKNICPVLTEKKDGKKEKKRGSKQTDVDKVDLTKQTGDSKGQLKCTKSSIDLTKSRNKAEKVSIIESTCLCHELVDHSSSKRIFNCIHCGSLYHSDCMKKPENSQTNECLPCHLKLIVPNRRVKKQLFLGTLARGCKRHEINFTLDLSEMEGCRLQMRCFRLKENMSNFILFPDLASIEVNGVHTKDFIPLHRQSSLKYRKDQPIIIDRSLVAPTMKVAISEEVTGRDCKDDRIESESHLIGFYIIEDMRCDDLCSNIQKMCRTSLVDSLKLLNLAWKNSDTQEISVEIIKIPLICTLTTQLIRVPARGVFCKHYQCFDLYNFVFLIAQSANPRWLCPLCRLPAYELRVDCILAAILNEHSDVKNLREVCFFNSEEYWIEEKGKGDAKRSIRGLFLDTVRKRSTARTEDGSWGGVEVISLVE